MKPPQPTYNKRRIGPEKRTNPRRWIAVLLLSVILVLGIVLPLAFSPWNLAEAQGGSENSFIDNSYEDLKQGTGEGVALSDTGFVHLKLTGAGSWDNVGNKSPKQGYYGLAVVGVGDRLYVISGLSGENFFVYNAVDDVWDTAPADPPVAIKSGTCLAWDNGDKIYALFGSPAGGVRENFWRYSISTDTWEKLENTPAMQGAGDAMAWVPGSAVGGSDDYIYATLGAGSHVTGFTGSAFYRYSINNGSWEDLSASFPWADTDDGASLVWGGGRYLYALRGEEHETTPNWDFARYDLITDTWDNLRTLDDDGFEPGGIGDGASLISLAPYNGNYSGYIFALGGGSASEEAGDNFYAYSVSEDRWYQLASIPEGVTKYVGNRLGFANGRIYFWEGMSKAGVGDDLYRFNFPAYLESGSFISRVFDARQPMDWESISWSATTPSGVVGEDCKVGGEPTTLTDGTSRVGSITGGSISDTKTQNSTYENIAEANLGAPTSGSYYAGSTNVVKGAESGGMLGNLNADDGTYDVDAVYLMSYDTETDYEADTNVVSGTEVGGTQRDYLDLDDDTNYYEVDATSSVSGGTQVLSNPSFETGNPPAGWTGVVLEGTTTPTNPAWEQYADNVPPDKTYVARAYVRDTVSSGWLSYSGEQSVSGVDSIYQIELSYYVKRDYVYNTTNMPNRGAAVEVEFTSGGTAYKLRYFHAEAGSPPADTATIKYVVGSALTTSWASYTQDVDSDINTKFGMSTFTITAIRVASMISKTNAATDSRYRVSYDNVLLTRGTATYSLDIRHDSGVVTTSEVSIDNIKVTLNFKSSPAATYYLQIYNFNTSSWEDATSGSVGPTEEVTWTVTKTTNPGYYIDDTSHVIRVRLYTTNESAVHSSQVDYLVYQVNSHTTGYSIEIQHDSSVVSYTGTLDNVTVKVNFKSSDSARYYWQIYDFASSNWYALHDEIVSTTEVTWDNTITLNPGNYISDVAGQENIRVRLYTTGEASAHSLQEDYLIFYENHSPTDYQLRWQMNIENVTTGWGSYTLKVVGKISGDSEGINVYVRNTSASSWEAVGTLSTTETTLTKALSPISSYLTGDNVAVKFESATDASQTTVHIDLCVLRQESVSSTSLSVYARASSDVSTWTDWMGPYPTAGGSAMNLWEYRYFQYKAEFTSNSALTPVLDWVMIKYSEPPVRKDTVLSIAPETFELYSDNSLVLTATLVDNDNLPLANKMIKWSTTAGSLSSGTGVTNDNGQVSVTYTAPTVTLGASVSVTASFAGDNGYRPSSAASSGMVWSPEAQEEWENLVKNLTQRATELGVPLEDEHLQALENAFVENNLGAIISIRVKAGAPEVWEGFKHPNIEVEVEVTLGEKIDVRVSSDVENGKSIVLLIDNQVLPDLQEIRVLVDNEEIGLADNYVDVLDPTDEDVPEHLVLLGGGGAQVLVSIPSFSTRTITITTPAAQPPPPAAFPIYIVLVAAIALAAVAIALIWRYMLSGARKPRRHRRPKKSARFRRARLRGRVSRRP